MGQNPSALLGQNSIAEPPSPDNTDAAAALAEFPALQLIDAPVRRRKAFASAAHGLAIDELTPIDLKACPRAI